MSDPSDDFAFWRDAIAGLWPKIPDEPQCGLYRFKQDGKWTPVHFYRSPIADENGEFVIRMRLNGIEDLLPLPDIWAKCASHPVSRQMYDNWLKTDKWLDQINWVGADEPFEDRVTIEDEIRIALTWYNSDGKGICSQLQADMAANFAFIFQGREKQAITALDQELKPIKAQEAAARTKWKPLIDRCAAMKRTIKDEWLGPWLKAHPGSMAGSHIEAKRISLHSREVLKLTDPKKFLRYLADRNEELPKEILEALTKIASKLWKEKGDPKVMWNAVEFPGTEIVKEESVV